MKKYFFIFFFFLFVMSSIAIFIITLDSIKFAKKKIKDVYNEKRIKEYNFILQKDKDYLTSIAEYLANSNIVKKAYKENNASLIYKEFAPLFYSFKKRHQIEEIHFFKYPLINFLKLPNNTKNFDASKKRLDILNIIISKKFIDSKELFFYYICPHYVGIRIVFPIKIKNKIIGSVSIGKNIINLISEFKELGTKKVSILLNDHLLKFSLLPKIYKTYEKKYYVKGDYLILGDKINFNDYVVTTIKLKDIFHNNLGTLLIADDYKKLFFSILKHIVLYIGIFIFIILSMFFFNISLLNYIIKELKKTNKFVDCLRTQNFDKLPHHIEVKNEINAHQQAILDAAKEIEILINILKAKNDIYYKKAYLDPLTGAFNRRFLEEKEHELFLKYKALKEKVAVLMFDIDNFKKINDTYGHDIGDIVLSEIGEIVKNLLRENDIFIRYGGEEFLVILEDVKLKDAIKIAEKIRKTIAEKSIKIGEDKKINVTVSIGISEIKKEDNNLFDAIKRADEKLYNAKRNGKNRFEI